MDLGSIFLILALAVLVAMFISRPFYDRKLKQARLLTASGSLPENKGLSAEQAKRHSSLLAERERLLTALQELDFDFSLGKIPAEDYPEQRAYLLTSGANILRQLDEIETPGAAGGAADAEARMEADAARLSLAGNQTPAAAAQDELEALIAERRRKHAEKSTGFCPKCGKPIQASDEFCPRCGKKL
jgi:hypothetical protein